MAFIFVARRTLWASEAVKFLTVNTIKNILYLLHLACCGGKSLLTN